MASPTTPRAWGRPWDGCGAMALSLDTYRVEGVRSFMLRTNNMPGVSFSLPAHSVLSFPHLESLQKLLGTDPGWWL